MSTQRRKDRSLCRNLLLLAVMFLGLISSGSLFTPSTKASPTEVITSFYSEPAHINLIGQKIIDCDSVFHFWGSTSVYLTREFIPCE